MPGPPPPPPPPGVPPPNLLSSSSSSSSSNRPGDGRGALLQSIRHGTKLKKTATNDRSNPSIGKISTSTTTTNSSSSSSNNNNNVKSGQVSQMSNGLGGLFASGMPKLRPTGIPLGEHRDDNSEINSNSNGSKSPPQKALFTSLQVDVQNALKKQMANDNYRNRGPPPPAPVRHISSSENLQSLRQGNHSNGIRKLSASQNAFPQFERSPTSPQPNISTLHRKANSNVNLPSLEQQTNGTPTRPNSRKPHLAPKPPVLNCKKSQTNGRPMSGGDTGGGAGITRANSMKNPRAHTPEVPSTDDYASKFGTVRNLSSLIDRNLSASTNNMQLQRLRTIQNAPRPSHVPPPPPPSKTSSMKPPNHAPPPPPNGATINYIIPQPPNHAPPPPPHRTAPSPRLPQMSSVPAPPPPPRHSSMKEGPQGRRTASTDLDVKFADRFRDPVQFPRPPHYRGLLKIYLSKTAANKQPAPPPPIHRSGILLDSC